MGTALQHSASSRLDKKIKNKAQMLISGAQPHPRVPLRKVKLVTAESYGSEGRRGDVTAMTNIVKNFPNTGFDQFNLYTIQTYAEGFHSRPSMIYRHLPVSGVSR